MIITSLVKMCFQNMKMVEVPMIITKKMSLMTTNKQVNVQLFNFGTGVAKLLITICILVALVMQPPVHSADAFQFRFTKQRCSHVISTSTDKYKINMPM